MSSTSAFDNVLTERRERVGIVTLNRPKVCTPSHPPPPQEPSSLVYSACRDKDIIRKSAIRGL